MSQNRVTLVFGRKGQGKSYWIKRRLDALRRHVPLIVWDPNREYFGPTGKDSIRNVDFCGSWRAFLEAQSNREGHLGRVLVQDDYRSFASFTTYVLNAGGLTCVIDELHNYVTPTQYPKAFKLLFHVGRHRRIDVFAASWRPYGLPPFLRGCADEIRAFQTTEPLDLDWYQKNCGEPFGSALPKLAPRRSLVWTPGSATVAPPT